MTPENVCNRLGCWQILMIFFLYRRMYIISSLFVICFLSKKTADMTKKSRSFCLKLSLNVLSFYILGCSSSNQKELTYFDIPKEVQSNFALSEIAESINYIALETTEDSFLSLIQNVLFSNDKLFAVDLSGKILVFDLNGKFLYQIGSQGEGPGQFFYLSSIVIDERSGLLHIASGRRIITYTLDNQYIGEKSFPFFIDYLEIIDNQLVMIAGQDGKKMGSKFVNQRSLFKVSTELDVVDSIPLLYIEMNEETGATFPFKNYISEIDEDNFIYIPVLINEPIVRDTLFKINESYLSPLFKLNFTPPLFDKEGNKLILIKNIFISRKSSLQFSEFIISIVSFVLLEISTNSISFSKSLQQTTLSNSLIFVFKKESISLKRSFL
jgi:hypothetical protein